jgi:hypothetical protein
MRQLRIAESSKFLHSIHDWNTITTKYADVEAIEKQN